MRDYNPVIFANLITGLIFAAGNVVVLLAPLATDVTVGVLGLVNSLGLLLGFLFTGKLAQSRTTPVDPETGAPLNSDYQRAS